MADLATIEKSAVKLAQDTSDWINKNIRDNKITVPEGYNVSNEITMALMMIAQTNDKNGRPALETCTRETAQAHGAERRFHGTEAVLSDCQRDEAMHRYLVLRDNQHHQEAHAGL